MDLTIEQEKPRRLVVLIPNYLTNNTDLAYKIHWMANQENLAVLYLVMVDNDDMMLAASRSMATMKAVTSDNKVTVESKLTGTDNWLKTLCELSSPGDIIVCHSEQTVNNGFMKAIPVSDFLPEHLNFPIRTLSGFNSSDRAPARKWLHEFFAIIGFLIIIAAFTWVQIKFDQAFDGSFQTILIMATFVIEVGAILTWNLFAYR